MEDSCSTMLEASAKVARLAGVFNWDHISGALGLLSTEILTFPPGSLSTDA